jgi:hypothetical protein
MMTVVQLEQEAFNCLSDVGYHHLKGLGISLYTADPELSSCCEVGLVYRLRDAIYQLNPQLIREDAFQQVAEAITLEATA